MVECQSIYGNRTLVPKEKLAFRPAVYVIIVNDGKFLLVHLRNRDTCFLLGGGVELGERVKDALWVRLDSLSPERFQFCGEEILQVAQTLTA